MRIYKLKKFFCYVIIILLVTYLAFRNNYYKSLLSLGYTKNEISKIKENFKKEEIKEYLLNKKYSSLLEYKKSTIFNINNLDRYYLYDKSSNNIYSPQDVVIYVEIGLDKPFYSNVNEVTNYNSKLVLINKYNRLPNNYNATDLITLNSNYSNSSQKLKSEAAKSIIKMIDDSIKLNLNIKIVSGYRTEEYQKKLFNNSIKNNGFNHALIYSAKPGHSEHQTGLTADINTTEESFSNTKEYKWLIKNSYKYGYIERYPKGKEFITGYSYEPWHFRYVGIEAANTIHKKNITFEEYYVIYVKYNSKISF